ncbi:MAG: T9SS type A sorting domain-containing protein [Ignavibacteriales bacterium]|nr:T9SS type A sorting domain-containing protein [Ignavibacteriales bacterium]
MFVTTEVSAQFDSIIFARNDIYGPRGVLFMGDQNDDGYDDFVLIKHLSTSGYDAKALLFHGGNPINPNPVLEVAFKGFIPNHISACDFNRDGYRDLIITTFNVKPLILNIYLGGPNMDTIPDFSFRAPDNSVGSYTFIGGDWYVDFNGDGYEELIVRAYEMFDRKSAFLIYNSSPEMDSIPDQIVTYYPDEAIQGSDITHGDLDGDGRTDLTFLLNSPSIPVNFARRRFVFGRADFSFQDTVNFLDSVDIVRTNRILQDINKDGKADLAMYDTKFKYPYWYRLAVSYGSRIIDYIPEEGFNAQNEGWLYSRSVGDVNGDGYGDFLTSLNYYGGRLFLGGKHRPDDTPIKYYAGPTNIIERVGDVNGDGLDDIGIGTHGEPGAAPGTFYIMAGERVAMAIEDGETETEEKEEITLKAYPNPTTGELTVEITGNYSGFAELRLYNTTGKELIKKRVEVTAGIITEKIDFRELNISSGVYIVDMLFKSTESETTERDNMNLTGKKKSVKIVLIK